MRKRCASIRLNSRREISLYYGTATPVSLESKMGLRVSDKEKNAFQIPKGFDSGYFDLRKVKDAEAKRRLTIVSHKLTNLLKMCENVLAEKEGISSPKELLGYIPDGERLVKRKSLNFGSWVDMVIGGKCGDPNNPTSGTYHEYENLKRKLEQWNGGAILERRVCEIRNIDFEAFGRWVNSSDGLNGRNYINLMKCFKHVMMEACRNGKQTGCVEAVNKPTFAFKSPENLKSRYCGMKGGNGKMNIIAIYRQDKMSGAFTKEQAEWLKKVDISAVDASNRKGVPLAEPMKSVLFDIILFGLETGMRPVDLIRISKDNINEEMDSLFYFPQKKIRMMNEGGEGFEKHIVRVRFNDITRRIYMRYKEATDNEFLFPVTCNVYKNGIYNYSSINKVETDLNKLLRAICADMPNLTFIPSMYTLRRTHITLLEQLSVSRAERRKIYQDIAAVNGTSEDMLDKHYIKDVL